MAHFLSKSTRSFDEFDTTWNELHFELIHFGCLNERYRKDFMITIYSCLLTYFKSPVARSGVIFGLYYLYQSQPNMWEYVPIRVSYDIWYSMFDFYLKSVDKGTDLEGAAIFDKLRKMKAFEFSNENIVTMIPAAETEFKKAINTLDKIEEIRRDKMANDPTHFANDESFNSLSKLYNNAKQTAFLTPQATLAMQAMLRESVNITENNQRMLQNVALRGPLHENDLVDQLDKVSKQLWHSRK
ncbi:hypothetical protein K501DRAFT_252942 [Backusella circina FSU 941]|nr:hypothetical protein K501DRAFT_252942 [Backusella circina FSU 941]